jgi:hypothetical protein
MMKQESQAELYGGDVILEFFAGRHRYLANGVPAESITGILKVINKPALLWWAVGLAGDHVRANLKPGSVVDELTVETLVDGLKKAHRDTSSAAATAGNLVHEWVSQHLKGENPPMPTNDKLRQSVEAFLRFQDEHDFQVKDSERKVYSREYNVAGTVDIIGVYQGEPVVADLKSGSGIFPEALLQTGGYDICLSEEIGTTFKKHLIINCQKDGTLKFHISDSVERNRDGFLAALKLFRTLEQITGELK